MQNYAFSDIIYDVIVELTLIIINITSALLKWIRKRK